MSTANTRFLFTADQIAEPYKTGIKSVGKMNELLKGLAGVTIIGDGVVTLILDTNVLIQGALIENKTLHYSFINKIKEKIL